MTAAPSLPSRARRCLVLLPLAALLAGLGPAAPAAPRSKARQQDTASGEEDSNQDEDRDPPRSRAGKARPEDGDEDRDEGSGRRSAKGRKSSADDEEEPPEEVKPPEPEPDPNEPRYSLEASHQDAVALIMEFARQANKAVTMIDTFVTRISVRFKDLTFEQGLRRLMMASDLDYVKDGDSYTVGLQCDLKLRYPGPRDKIVDGTYRCRRISAATLVKTIQAIMGDVDIKATPGPEFLTPAVEAANTGTADLSIKALAPTDPNYHTHDVVFSGAPSFVARALSLARKFDQPRKQVRVNVRIVEITSEFERKIGVNWQSALGFQAVEQPSDDSSSSNPSVNGIKLGRFNHSPLTLTATLNALETQGDAKTLSNPTLLVLDGEKSFILSGTKYVYPQIKERDNSGSPVYSIETEKVGVYLQVGVQVGLDDDMVLSIYPQVTAVQTFQPINGGNYPIITTHEEQATVRAIRGDVIVLGGLKIDRSTFNNPSVPYLSKIPILGRLFSAPDKVHDTDELMIFLTPDIVEDVPPPLDLKLETLPSAAARESTAK